MYTPWKPGLNTVMVAGMDIDTVRTMLDLMPDEMIYDLLKNQLGILPVIEREGEEA